MILSIPEALSVTSKVCSSVNIGSTRAGINMDAVALMGISFTNVLRKQRIIIASVPRNWLCFVTLWKITLYGRCFSWYR